jgi:hypothetical protein
MAVQRRGQQDLSDRAIKRRLGAAAKQLGYRLTWARQHSPEALYFQVVGAPAARPTNGRRPRRVAAPIPAPTAVPAPEPEPTTARSGRGRPERRPHQHSARRAHVRR